MASKLFVIKSRHPDVGSTDKTPDRKPQTGSASHDRPATLVAPKRLWKFGIIIQPVYKVACAAAGSAASPASACGVPSGSRPERTPSCRVKRTAHPKRLALFAAHRPSPAFTRQTEARVAAFGRDRSLAAGTLIGRGATRRPFFIGGAMAAAPFVADRRHSEQPMDPANFLLGFDLRILE